MHRGTPIALPLVVRFRISFTLHEHSVWIRAMPEEVWRVYVDPSRIPEWQIGSPVIEDVRGAGDRPGTTYTSKRGPGVAQTTVLEAERPRRLVTRTQAYLGLKFDVVSRLEPEADGTQLELHAETHWPRGLGMLGKTRRARRPEPPRG